MKDQPVLAEDDDVLVNVNILDDERYKKNVLIKSKKPGYDAYDEENFDEFGFSVSSVLKKYDEEIDGEKKDSFAIGYTDPNEIKRRQAEIVKQRLANKRLETLELPEMRLASDYYNEEELTKFKKPKRKVRKVKRGMRMLKADDLLPDDEDADGNFRDLGSRNRRIDEDLTNIKIEDDGDLEKQIKHKTLKLKKPITLAKPDIIAEGVKQEPQEEARESRGMRGSIALNSTAEFCRTLGDIPTYGHSGNREDRPDFKDFDMEYANPNVSIISHFQFAILNIH